MTKKCSGCGKSLTWASLPFVGYQDDGAGGWLELRNCTCRSTQSVRVSVEVVGRRPPSADFAEFAAPE